MNEGRALTATEFGEVIHEFDHTAFRLELQDTYLEAEEAALLAAFLRGAPKPPIEIYKGWYERVAEHVQAGKRIERVRVQQDPPTDYQRFERWLDRWNIEAGENMRYLTRERAHDIGLLPAVGRDDWWLLDSSKLIVMRFDEQGHRIHNELVTDPTVVVQACKWRDLAVHHSAVAHSHGVAV